MTLSFISTRTSSPRIAAAMLGFALALGLLVPLSATAESRMSATYESTIDAPTIEVGSNLDMDDDGYNSDYIFGMTRGVADSTMVPAIKPIFFLVTIPLDIVFLPFAAIGGFF